MLVRRALSFAAFTLVASCATDSTAPGSLKHNARTASDIEVPVDAGALVVNAIYNDADYASYGTDGCPITVRLQRGTSSVNSGPCVFQGPFQFNNLQPGSWDVHASWGLGFAPIESVNGVSIVAGTVTNTSIDISNDVGIVYGTIQVNGVPPQSATLCARSPLDANGNPTMDAGSVCKGFNSMPGVPTTGDFKFFVRGGAGRLELTGFGGIHIGQIPIVVNSGETRDLGVINFELGGLRVTPLYNGLQHPFGTDGCPLSVRAQSPSATINSGPCSTPAPPTFTLSNLAGGTYTVGVLWGMAFAPFVTQQATVLPPNTTDVNIDISGHFGIVKGDLLVNGQPPNNMQLCVRAPVDATGNPTMSAGSICKFFQSMPGMPSNSSFALLVPAGAAKLEIANGSLGTQSITIIAGQTLDLGTITAGVGSMKISPTFNGQPYATFNTDECPFTYSASGPTNAFSGPCFSQSPVVLANLQPGAYNVGVRFSNSFSPLATQAATVTGGTETDVNIDMTNHVAIISGTVLVNGAPPVDVTVCVRAPLDAAGNLSMNAGSICKWFRPPMAGMPASGDTRFRFFVPKGCFKGEVLGTGGSILGTFQNCVDAGEDVDLGNPLDPPPPPANRPPTITSIGGPYSGNEGSPIQFTATATDPDGNPLTYEWNFGDGSSGMGPSVNHVYDDNGNYNVTLTVRDPAGLSATATASAVVANVNPIAVLFAPSSVNSGSPFGVALTAPFDAGRADLLAGYSFSLNCGAGFGAYGPSPSANCAGVASGPITVGGRIRDKDGGVSEYTKSVNVIVLNTAPVVSIVAPVTTLLQGEQFSATGSFADPDMNPWTATVAYEGSTTPLALSGKTFALSHQYMTAGTFTVVVTVNDGHANSTASVVVRVMSIAEALAEIAAYTRANVGASEIRPLLASLDAAIASLDRGNSVSAKNQLEAYLNKLSAFVATGKVSATTGATLETKVRKILSAI